MAQKSSSDVFIYALICPLTDEVRYIGKTNNPYQRLACHISEASQKKRRSQKWINSLLLKGLKPSMQIIHEATPETANNYEKFFIALFRSDRLTNQLEGGEGRSSESMSGANNPMFGRRLYGRKNGFFQRHHTEETKKILAEKCPRPSKFKNRTDRWSDEKKTQIKLNQKNRKTFQRIKDGIIVDKWNSVREICRELEYDRRTVQRVLAKKKSYDTINGHQLEYC